MKHVFLILLVSILWANNLNGQCLVGDCNNGYGVFQLENGDFYAGNWENGAREGYGRYDWANGAFYVGGFKFNGLHGIGTFYSIDGSKASGIFEDNIYVGDDTAKLKLPIQQNADEMQLTAWFAADSIAQAQARILKQVVPFPTAVQQVVADFAADFTNSKGPDRAPLLDRSPGWHSTVIAEGALNAYIYAATESKKAIYYSVLFSGTDSVQATKNYYKYIAALKPVQFDCCSFLTDTYDFTGPYYSSFTTTYVTLNTNTGYSEDVYLDMAMAIELHSGLDNIWKIIFKVYHLSDK